MRNHQGENSFVRGNLCRQHSIIDLPIQNLNSNFLQRLLEGKNDKFRLGSVIFNSGTQPSAPEMAGVGLDLTSIVQGPNYQRILCRNALKR